MGRCYTTLRQLQRVWPPLTVGLLGLAAPGSARRMVPDRRRVDAGSPVGATQVVLFTSPLRSRHKGDTALRASGIDVFRATHETVGETVAGFTVGTLQLVGMSMRAAFGTAITSEPVAAA